MSKYYEISKVRAQNGKPVGRVDIYGSIEPEKHSDGEVSPKSFAAELDALGSVSAIEVHIFSDGGCMFSGLAIYEILASRPEHISVYIDGKSASAATIIACAGDVVYMPESAMMFYHLPMVDAFIVNENSARKTAEDLAKLKTPMVAAYKKKCGKDDEEIKLLLNGADGFGTWLTAQEAISFGLVDAITPNNRLPLEVAACISPNVYNYKGHRIDFTRFDKTAGIAAGQTGGKKMFNFFGKKNQPKAAVNFIETKCTQGHINLLNPITGEIIQTGENGEVAGQKTGFASKLAGNFKADTYSIGCLECGEVYGWDCSLADSQTETETFQETAPISESAQSPAPAVAASAAKKIRAEIFQSKCPACAAINPVDTTGVEQVTDPEGVVGYPVVCSACDYAYVAPIPEPEYVPEAGAPTASYMNGVRAERQRQLALDEIAAACPAMKAQIEAAKKSNVSAETIRANAIRAMASGKIQPVTAQGSQAFMAALTKDIQASGVNSIGNVQHAAAPKSIKDSAYENRRTEYNKRMGVKNDD